MSFTLADLDFLASGSGASLLERLAGEDFADDHTLRLLTALRREWSPSQAGAALELARLRKKAVAKFGAEAARMFFTRDALEQASSPIICNWRALHFAGHRRIIDACCSIGADSLAFARANPAADVLGLDIDPVRVAMARLNAAALGVPNARYETADVRQTMLEADLIFFDPARRGDDGRRIYNVEHYQPPLSTVRGWQARQVGVKLSPGVDLAQLEPYGGVVDFISVRGELKEALLQVSPELHSASLRTGALLLTDDPRAPEPLLGYWAQEPLPLDDPPLSEPLGWLVEPDPSIIRAGLVVPLAVALGGTLLDREIAYITTAEHPQSHWVRAWRILGWMPFNLKKLRAYLRERDVGTVTVKKRGTAVTPEALIPKLRLNGSGSRTIVLTRCRGEHVVLVCNDLTVEKAG